VWLFLVWMGFVWDLAHRSGASGLPLRQGLS
jgi:hypothetical protein